MSIKIAFEKPPSNKSLVFDLKKDQTFVHRNFPDTLFVAAKLPDYEFNALRLTPPMTFIKLPNCDQVTLVDVEITVKEKS